DELLLLDIRPPSDEVAAHPIVRCLIGELEATIPSLGHVDIVFHLAGVVSAAAEADFDLGMQSNLYGLIALLDHLRKLESTPVVVFTSSLAVFGQDPAGRPLGVVD